MTIAQSLADRAMVVRLMPDDAQNCEDLTVGQKREICELIRAGCEVRLFAWNGKRIRRWERKEGSDGGSD